MRASEWERFERLGRHPRHGLALARWNFGDAPSKVQVEAARAIGLDSPVARRRGFARRLLGTDLTAHLADVRLPVLVLAGSRDRVVAPRESVRLGELLPDARVEILEGAGHMLPIERAQEVVERVLAFADELGVDEWPRRRAGLRPAATRRPQEPVRPDGRRQAFVLRRADRRRDGQAQPGGGDQPRRDGRGSDEHGCRHGPEQGQADGGECEVDERPLVREASEQPSDAGSNLNLGVEWAEVVGEAGDQRSPDDHRQRERSGGQQRPQDRLQEIDDRVAAPDVDPGADRDAEAGQHEQCGDGLATGQAPRHAGERPARRRDERPEQAESGEEGVEEHGRDQRGFDEERHEPADDGADDGPLRGVQAPAHVRGGSGRARCRHGAPDAGGATRVSSNAVGETAPMCRMRLEVDGSAIAGRLRARPRATALG